LVSVVRLYIPSMLPYTAWWRQVLRMVSNYTRQMYMYIYAHILTNSSAKNIKHPTSVWEGCKQGRKHTSFLILVRRKASTSLSLASRCCLIVVASVLHA
jgi:hypothetical protein